MVYCALQVNDGVSRCAAGESDTRSTPMWHIHRAQPECSRFNPLGRVNGSQVAVPGMRAFHEAQNHGVQNRPRPRLTHRIPSRYVETARIVHVNCILRIHEVCTLQPTFPSPPSHSGRPVRGDLNGWAMFIGEAAGFAHVSATRQLELQRTLTA
jgi:hypothetical protein